jgi:opacity protein-like surface antigen
MRLKLTFAAALLTVPALAQKYEFGVQGGGSLYQSKEISNSRGSADAGFSQGWSAGFTVGHNMYTHVGGEIRYSYLHNKMKLTSGGTSASFGGEAHAIHYDFLIHATERSARVRPYVALGGGVKIYRGTGAEQAFQPLSNVAVLTKTQEPQGLASFGGGVKVKISERTVFRFDVHDYLTPFPKKVITPVTGSGVSGWLNNIVPTAGLTFTF